AALNGLVYAPAANFNGLVSLSVTTNDLGNTGSGGPLSDTDSVAITVNAVNDAPIASNQTVTTNEDTAVSITLIGADIDGDALTFKITALPTNGSLYAGGNTSGLLITAADLLGSGYSLAGTQVTYMPTGDYFGGDAFSFVSFDGQLASPTGTASIT